ncbi:heat-inducible transcriptional repressor HrcA [Wansuia hejianensis]|uniref:Heat-inducible transcription repressor HrcA n=1 Tax=Wansuia hejianensis TaxID=2763667 RepID=A0A926EYE3_9FIRM|nr:heat-inducible transcriptional repressor HrcA [Wansuia hejianensis]MBC8590780.1 heat-inducible transcription repressor HrcA [Wansuia hejianensis]
MLDERKLKVLYAIINSYISSAEPIGSRTISKNYDLGVSSATIRNEMSDLEDLGFLSKPHSSAGRVPSDKAYRFYVNQLLKQNKQSIGTEKDIEIKEILANKSWEMEELIRNSAEMLSALTSYTAIVASPKLKTSKVKTIQLLSLDDLRVLMIIVCDTGIVKKAIYKPKNPISSDQLSTISKFLNIKLQGLSMDELLIQFENNVFEEMYKYKGVIDELIPIINDSIEDLTSIDLYSYGLTKILNFPEYRDVEKVKEFISFVEDKDLILDILLNNSSSEDIDILIGSENKYAPIKDISMITATYKIGNKTISKVGLVGPTRMDYLNLIDTLKIFSANITDMLNMLMGNQ